jgi:hypothetical protein
VLPHWAAWAGGVRQASRVRVRKVAVVRLVLLVIRKFLGWRRSPLQTAA